MGRAAYTLVVVVFQSLKPDGVFLASMLGGTTLTELRIALQLAEMEREVRGPRRQSHLEIP